MIHFLYITVLLIVPIADIGAALDSEEGEQVPGDPVVVADKRPMLPPFQLPKPDPLELRRLRQVSVGCTAFSPTGSYLVLGTECGRAIVWNLQSGTQLLAEQAHQKRITHIAFGRRDERFLTGADDLMVTLWDVSMGRADLSFPGTAMRRLYEIALSPDGRYALSRGFDGFGKLWDLQQNREAMTLFTYGFA